jgi:hypothetical protein
VVAGDWLVLDLTLLQQRLDDHGDDGDHDLQCLHSHLLVSTPNTRRRRGTVLPRLDTPLAPIPHPTLSRTTTTTMNQPTKHNVALVQPAHQ